MNGSIHRLSQKPISNQSQSLQNISWNKVKKFGFSKSTHQFNISHKYLETLSSHPHLWLQQRFKDYHHPLTSHQLIFHKNKFKKKKKKRISKLADEQNPSIISPLFSFFSFFLKMMPSVSSTNSSFLISRSQGNFQLLFFSGWILYKALFGSVFLFYIQATATVLDGFLVGWAVVAFCLRAFLEEGIIHLFSLASTSSSNSICSCLHSWLQNGVFPLYMNISLFWPSCFRQRKQDSRKWDDPWLYWSP